MKTILFISLVSSVFGTSPASQCFNRRPSFDELINLLNNEIQWMGLKFFNGADPLVIAEALIMASDVSDLSLTIGMTSDNEQNLRNALEAIPKDDAQYFLDLGMSSCSWNQVRYVFQQLLDGGFKV